MFKAQHPSQVFVSAIRVVVRDGSHLVVFLRVFVLEPSLGWSAKFDSAEFTHVEGKPVVPSMWFAAPRPYMLCYVGVIAMVLGAAMRCGDAFAASCFQPFYAALLILLVAMLVQAFSLRRTWNETGWTFMHSMFSVLSEGQAMNKECAKGKCFSTKWFMNILVSQALTAACLAAAFKEMAKIFRKHAAACISVKKLIVLSASLKA